MLTSSFNLPWYSHLVKLIDCQFDDCFNLFFDPQGILLHPIAATVSIESQGKAFSAMALAVSWDALAWVWMLQLAGVPGLLPRRCTPLTYQTRGLSVKWT